MLLAEYLLGSVLLSRIAIVLPTYVVFGLAWWQYVMDKTGSHMR